MLVYGLDFRRRAVALVQGGQKVATVAKWLGISRITLHRWLKRKDLAPERMGPKVPRRCCPEKLAAHVEAFPDAYQYERAIELQVSQPAICYGLKRLGFKKTVRYREKDDERRNKYLKTLESIPEEKRVYVDETGFNEPLIREYAYGKKGERLLGERTGKRFARTSVIAGLRLNKSLAPMDWATAIRKWY